MTSTRRLAAIMFTDVVDYTSSTQDNEALSLELLKEQEELVRPLLTENGGRAVKSTGDGFLVEFDSALRAVQCAIEILHRLEERNAAAGVTPIRLRIGVHLGDVEEREGDIFGDAVNIAARIQPLAPPGGLCISGPVFDQVRNKLKHQFEKLPPTPLKHVRIPIDVYRVVLSDNSGETPSGTPSRTRLAVLPLSNISPDPKDEYFADGLTEELISALSKLRDLRVIARTSVSQYKATSKPVSQIGTELGVGTVLEGSVRKAGNHLRISLQLIETGTQEHIWADTFDRELDDVFAIQSEIAEKTAGALRLELLGSERESINKQPTANLAAYNAYLKGLHAYRQSFGAIDSSRIQAIEFFEEAIRLDPEFSQAISALANTYITFAGNVLDPKDAYPRAEKLIVKALRLDPTSSEAHTARGNLALQYELDWALAERQFQMAISLNPSNANAHWWYSVLLTNLQRFEEGLHEARQTSELDPLWELPNATVGQIMFLTGDYAGAAGVIEQTLKNNPKDPFSRGSLGFVYMRQGRLEEARRQAELADQYATPLTAYGTALLWTFLGKPEPARALLAAEPSRTQYTNPGLIAQLYVAVGENEKALECLERDQSTRGSSFPFYYQTFTFDPIRNDPRFQAMLRRMNLPLRQGKGSRSGRERPAASRSRAKTAAAK